MNREVKKDIKSVANGLIIGGALGLALERKKIGGFSLIAIGLCIYLFTWQHD